MFSELVEVFEYIWGSQPLFFHQLTWTINHLVGKVYLPVSHITKQSPWTHSGHRIFLWYKGELLWGKFEFVLVHMYFGEGTTAKVLGTVSIVVGAFGYFEACPSTNISLTKGWCTLNSKTLLSEIPKTAWNCTCTCFSKWIGTWNRLSWRETTPYLYLPQKFTFEVGRVWKYRSIIAFLGSGKSLLNLNVLFQKNIYSGKIVVDKRIGTQQPKKKCFDIKFKETLVHSLMASYHSNTALSAHLLATTTNGQQIYKVVFLNKLFMKILQINYYFWFVMCNRLVVCFPVILFRFFVYS